MERTLPTNSFLTRSHSPRLMATVICIAVLLAGLAGLGARLEAADSGAVSDRSHVATSVEDVHSVDEAALWKLRIPLYVYQGGRWVSSRTLQCFPNCTWSSYRFW